MLASPALIGLGSKAADARPNILYILTDDQRWDAMSCMGHPFVRTPNMDRLAREGAHFQNAFVTTPLCSPSRASFLTGQFAHRHGILDNSERNEQSHTLTTFPRILRENGYETGYIGKWHMGHRDDTPRPGFDHWISFKGQGQYVDPEMNRNGERGKVSGYVTDILSKDTADYIRKSRTKPFCLTLAHKAIHGPFTPADRHKDLFADVAVSRAPSASDDLSTKPALRASQPKPPASGPPRPHRGPSDDTIRNMMRALVSVDEGLGLILDALRDTRQLDNTFIVFAGDNGYFNGEHGLGDKRRAYEEGIRIPFLVRYPRLVRAASKPVEMALNIDLAPTVLSLAGVRTPPAMQGRSLLPVVQGKAGKWRDSILTEYFVDPPYPATQKWQSIRTRDWKWIHYPELADADELYDLRDDPGEMRNRISEAALAPVVAGMRADVSKQLAR
jgi:N-acetylglucosamine-6-sulfatase